MKSSRLTSTDILLILITSVMVPVVSRLAFLIQGSDTLLTTDRLFSLYFASLSGKILSDKCIRLLKGSGLYKKGFRLGNSDAFPSLLCAVPVSIAAFCWDSVFGVCFLLIVFLLAALVLWFDRDIIAFSGVELGLIGIVMVVLAVVYFFIFDRGNIDPTSWIITCLSLLVSQAVVCLVFDLAVMQYNKKEEGKKH